MKSRRLAALTAVIAGLSGCAGLPGADDGTAGPVLSAAGVMIELEQSRTPTPAERRYAQKVADEIWAQACAGGAAKPCNAGSYYRISLTLELRRDIYCLGTMRGPLADQGAPVRQPDGTVRELSPWVETVEFRCLSNGRAFIESWY